MKKIIITAIVCLSIAIGGSVLAFKVQIAGTDLTAGPIIPIIEKQENKIVEEVEEKIIPSSPVIVEKILTVEEQLSLIIVEKILTVEERLSLIEERLNKLENKVK